MTLRPVFSLVAATAGLCVLSGCDGYDARAHDHYPSVEEILSRPLPPPPKVTLTEDQILDRASESCMKELQAQSTEDILHRPITTIDSVLEPDRFAEEMEQRKLTPHEDRVLDVFIKSVEDCIGQKAPELAGRVVGGRDSGGQDPLSRFWFRTKEDPAPPGKPDLKARNFEPGF